MVISFGAIATYFTVERSVFIKPTYALALGIVIATFLIYEPFLKNKPIISSVVLNVDSTVDRHLRIGQVLIAHILLAHIMTKGSL